MEDKGLEFAIIQLLRNGPISQKKLKIIGYEPKQIASGLNLLEAYQIILQNPTYKNKKPENYYSLTRLGKRTMRSYQEI